MIVDSAPQNMDYSNVNWTENCTKSQLTQRVLPIFYAIICLCAFILNGLAAWIFFRVPSSSVLVVYLKNMGVADILMLFTFPLRVARDLGYGGSQLKLIVCRYTAVLFYLCMYTGITLMSFISLERYFKIVHSTSRVSSLLQRVTVGKAMAFLTWIVMTISSLPNTVLVTNQPIPQDFTCIDIKSQLGRRWHEISVHFTAGVFWVAFMLMVFCYTSIACHVYRSIRRVQQNSSEAGRRSHRSIFSLLAVFVLCFVPYHICRVPYTLSQLFDNCSTYTSFVLYQIKEFALFLSALNVCLDPVIYFFMCKTFRNSLLQKVSVVKVKNRRSSVGTEQTISHL